MDVFFRLVRDAAPRWAGPILAALAYYAAATGALALATGSSGIVVVWPAAGVLLAALLLAPRTDWIRYVATSAVACVLANLQFGFPAAVTLGLTAANLTESAFAAWLMNRRGVPRPSFVHPNGRSLGTFCLAAAAACAASALVSAAAVRTFSPVFLLTWFSTDLLGMLVIAPMILIAEELRRTGRRMNDRRKVGEAAALVAVTAATAVATFAHSRHPLLFLPILPLLASVLRLGPLGAAGGVWIIATIGSFATGLGTGPVQLVEGPAIDKVRFLQLYLLVTFASALPIATLIAARARLSAELAHRNRLLNMAESVAQVGHWRLDAVAGSLFWSDEVFRIHGRPTTEPPTLAEAIDAYHPDDREGVAETIRKALDEGSTFGFTARLLRPDGLVRHVLSRGAADHDEGGAVAGLFGVFQDISLQVANEEALERARAGAEEAARRATLMAETDQLTELPSRRKTLRVLEEAVCAARAAGEVVSVAIFDIDHFKRINDVLGHAVGDEVLRAVARSAGAAVRAGDLIGRVGGEEFVLVLPDTRRDRAMEIAERVRLAVQAGDGAPPKVPRVSASFGVASLAPRETADALLRRADGALYEAKQAGRNTLRCAA